MFTDSVSRKKAVRSIIFIVLFLLGITIINYRNRHLENKETLLLTANIQIFVKERPLNGLNENLLCEKYFIDMIGKQIIEDLNNRLPSKYFHLENQNSDSTKIIDTCYQNVKDKNFVVIKHKYKETINATSVIGIKDTKLIQITAYSTSSNVPYSYGPCAKKMKEIFGFSLKHRNRHS
jgi:hypothetical protein